MSDPFLHPTSVKVNQISTYILNHYHLFKPFHSFTFQSLPTPNTIMIPPPPSPSPAPSPLPFTTPFPLSSSSSSSLSSSSSSSSSSSKLPVDFSPPLILMVIIIAGAFIFITYSRLISRQFLTLHRHYLRWRLRRRRRYAPSSSAGNMDSPPYPFHPSENAFHLFSPYGLDETAIRTIPLAVYNRKSFVIDCAVCLLEFEDND